MRAEQPLPAKRSSKMGRKREALNAAWGWETLVGMWKCLDHRIIPPRAPFLLPAFRFFAAVHGFTKEQGMQTVTNGGKNMRNFLRSAIAAAFLIATGVAMAQAPDWYA